MSAHRITPDMTAPGQSSLAPIVPDRLAVLKSYWRLEDVVCREYLQLGLEGKTVLGFLADQLMKLGVKSESECLAGDLDLMDWIQAGLKFGRRIKAEQPQLVANIIKECEGKRLDGSRSVIGRVVKQARRIAPVSLIRPLLDWYTSLYRGEAPRFYGQRLARVGCIADFAVWIPWLHPGAASSRGQRGGTGIPNQPDAPSA
ncbi:MAG TPA: hypothetical protein VL970_09005 [Candidatus Acidoferrales bacterium]|nr:hypothetical protein [Candidatus Acidoferrales bacterium]